MSRVGDAFAALAARMVPASPDFHGLLVGQCDAVLATLDAFLAFVQEGDGPAAEAVRAGEREADLRKAATLDALNRAFATPFDRDLLYLAIVRIDAVANDAKAAVREMGALGIGPDDATRAMAASIREGGAALRAGFQALRRAPGVAEAHGEEARQAERAVEREYRAAIALLLDGDPELALAAEGDLVGALRSLLVDLRRREVYRHLANAADRLADAADTLVDIAVASA